MLTKLIHSTGLVSTATLIAMASFMGYLLTSGRLDAPRAQAIAAVLRGEHPYPPTTQPAAPATQPAADASHEPPTIAEPTEVRRRQELMESLRLERARADLEARQRILDQLMLDVVAGQEKLERMNAERAQDAARKTAAAKDGGGASDDGFQKELQLFSQMKPALAKEHLVRVWATHKEDAIRLVVNLDDGRSKRLFEQFKTPDEMKMMSELLEQIRTQGIEGLAEPSGTTAADSP